MKVRLLKGGATAGRRSAGDERYLPPEEFTEPLLLWECAVVFVREGYRYDPEIPFLSRDRS